MSLPAPGNYYIVNTVPSADYNLLAITFTNESNPLSVSPLVTSECAQVWTIQDYDSETQTISPKDDPMLQIAFGDGYLTTLPEGAYTWTIRGDGNSNYTFRDGGRTVYWDIKMPESKEEVTYSSVKEPAKATEFWYLYPTK